MVLYGKRSVFVRFLVGDVRIRVLIRSGFVRFLFNGYADSEGESVRFVFGF